MIIFLDDDIFSEWVSSSEVNRVEQLVQPRGCRARAFSPPVALGHYGIELGIVWWLVRSRFRPASQSYWIETLFHLDEFQNFGLDDLFVTPPVPSPIRRDNY